MFTFLKRDYFLHFKGKWLLSQVSIFKISWLFIFWKSTVYLHIQNRLLFEFSKSADYLHFQVSWLFTFSESADCLHFQSQLMAWSNIFLNVLLLIFRSIRKLHCDTKLWIWHEIMQFLTEGETRTGQGQQIKSLEALLRDRA